jgi:cytochrome c556
MMSKMRGTIVIVALAICTITLPADSHDGAEHGHATGVVKERMMLMEEIGKRMKTINMRIKDKQQLSSIKDDARAIAASAAQITRLFPAGSNQHPTEARAVIWKSFSDFESKAKALELESTKLAETSASDLPGITAQVRMVSQTCGACHERYRTKE